jgi:ribonuclease Z
MLENAPVKSLKHGVLTVEGYSRAAVQTYWRIPELKLGFDLGAHPWDFMGVPTWFISHTHLDHIASIPSYVARRRMMKMEPPVIYMPEYSVPTVQRILKSFSRLDRGHLPCDLIGVVPGDEIALSRELVVTVGQTKHTIPSLCFIVWERRNKLKPQYSHLSGDEIRDLKIAGTEITDELRFPIVGYSGDTAPEGLDNNPDLYKAKILITELTFIAPSHRKDKIHKHGHMHLDDLIERRQQFQNEIIVAGHVSTRYTGKQAQRAVAKRIPDMFDGRLHVWV